MELKVSSVKPGGLSPSECTSDPEEKEVSDEDDDDRNHKHRRRETRSQSLDRDALEPTFTRPYRKRNKPFENGHPCRDEPQASETWKNYNMGPLERDLTAKFERRRPGLVSLPRGPFDLNQRLRGNQPFSGDPGPGRGRGRDSALWSQRDSRFGSVDLASQMVQTGSIAPSLFAGRGLPNVSNSPPASWSAFGMIPGIPNGALDTIHSIGLQGTFCPPVNSSINMGIPRQRCRDFEERGFCLRGDMCPMEHGINRIVVEDVQSLSQFNLPVSLSSAQLVGAPAGPGSLSAVGASSSPLMNQGLHNKSSKPAAADDGLGLNGPYSGSASAGDLYDPDQPLWNNNCPETSTALLALHSPKIDEVQSMLNVDSSDRRHAKFSDSADIEYPTRSSGIAAGPQGTSSSIWGRIGGSRNRVETKEKNDLAVSSSDFLENECKEEQEELANIRRISRQGKRNPAEDAGSKGTDFPPKSQSDSMRHIRRSSQKAQRTLFVNGIPQSSNKQEALFSHFRKFGEVIDIYIPLNSERAFVQFSKREEAEAALRAPDAVMGNRFIKLWWANRDSIADDGISSSSNLPVTSRGAPAASVPPVLSDSTRGKNDVQTAASKDNVVNSSDVSLPASDHHKPVIPNGPKVQPPLQKKLESLEQLKEELRRKQEMLDQKRNDFRRKLDKLAKQATVVKGEVGPEQAAKRHKAGMAADGAKATTPRACDPGAAVASPRVEVMIDKNKSTDSGGTPSPKTNTAIVLQESTGLKQLIRPAAVAGTPFLMNRYKLDNRPTAFRITPPLPAAFANVAVLKEHFSSYGDLSTVELDNVESCGACSELETLENCSARVTFNTRRSAERAFVHGNCWQGHNMQFVWIASSNPGTDPGGRDDSTSGSKVPLSADVPSEE